MDKERKGRKEGKQTGDKGDRKMVRERKKMGGKKKGNFLGVLTIGAQRSEKKSRSTHRELCMGTKIFEFRQNP